VRPDFFRAILNRLKNNEPVSAVTDHVFTPTFIDDIAFALDILIKSNSQGIFHVVGSQNLTPFAAANLIAGEFVLDKSKISKLQGRIFLATAQQGLFNCRLKMIK